MGFRFTAIGIARDLKVCGWAKNLSDGRVELVVEAEEDTLKDFLNRISNRFSGYLQDVETDWKAATGEFKDFTVEI